ncbi:MAG TPA: SNF2-related protein [Isosphaeraceae bacterium]|nr:SNF2-related protein [Isosphaeraceae bacterium]
MGDVVTTLEETKPMPRAPEAGQIVRVRQRQYFVEEVVPRAAGDDATLVRMSCLDDDAQGQPLEVLWEKEVDSEPITAESWQKIASKGFDPPKLFSAYLHTLQWNCVTSTDPNLFQSPFRAGIRIDAYQLEPLQKALRLPRVNLFIADDVGLGKTIEAGLIARELLLRKKAQDIVVSCPPSMLLQWHEELEDRFGMVFQILDKEYITRVRQERGYGVNPWTTHTRFLVSHRLLIDETYTATLRDWLGDFRPGLLLILDEAHHAAPSSGAKIDRFEFPALDQRQGADPTWAETMDTLRAPRNRDQKPWEWRRDSPIRPVVFHDTGTMDQDVVHLHLEHRVVQRLLGRFTAQGFVLHDLSRACLAQSNDAMPRVILMGRLCLYGPRAARLHAELVPITARWSELSQRKQGLSPYGRAAELKTLDLLETALLPTGAKGVNPVIQEKLRIAAARDITELLPHLEKRGRELAEGARLSLAERAEQEATAMRTILEEQKTRVAETATKYKDAQLLLDFNDDEQRQLESNKRHWEKRLNAIDHELATEPARIRSIYEVKAQRIEPIGLVYLWPVTG